MKKCVFFQESYCPMFTSTHMLIVITCVLIIITHVLIMCTNCLLHFLIFAMALIVKDIYISSNNCLKLRLKSLQIWGKT